MCVYTRDEYVEVLESQVATLQKALEQYMSKDKCTTNPDQQEASINCNCSWCTGKRTFTYIKHSHAPRKNISYV